VLLDTSLGTIAGKLKLTKTTVHRILAAAAQTQTSGH
jgi:hypothetical protein